MFRQKAIPPSVLDGWKNYLIQMEKSAVTIQKYTHDMMQFLEFLGKSPVTKEKVLEYKHLLHEKGYLPRSINSKIISLNRFFDYMDWPDLHIKTEKIQTRTFCKEETELTKKEYERLVLTASKERRERLEYIIQTICGTGIRISELKYITAEAVISGKAVVTSKGKTREVFLVTKLRKKLLAYINRNNIKEGPVFVTKTGKSVSRSNIWKEMKSLCKNADVEPSKVFPHNLRHLFARIFYDIHKDIAKLADILGHSNVETTRIYIISSGAEHRKCMEKMQLII